MLAESINQSRDEYQDFMFREHKNLSQADVRIITNIATERGVSELGKQVVGEPIAKELLLAQNFAGSSYALNGRIYGDPEGGKSKLLKAIHQVFDYKEYEVADVQGNEEVTTARLIGTIDNYHKTTQKDGETITEEIKIEQDQILKPGVRYIKVDEGDKLSPPVFNALLKILQDGYIDVFDDEGNKVRVNKFDSIIVAGNIFGAKWSYEMGPAVISRFGWGVEIGKYEEGELSEGGQAILYKDFKEQPISPIMPRQKLYEIRSKIDFAPMSEEKKRLLGKLIVKSRETLRDFGLNVGGTRSLEQSLRLTKILSMMRNHEEVQSQDVVDAVTHNFVGKFASLNPIDHNGQPIDALELGRKIMTDET